MDMDKEFLQLKLTMAGLYGQDLDLAIQIVEGVTIGRFPKTIPTAERVGMLIQLLDGARKQARSGACFK